MNEEQRKGNRNYRRGAAKERRILDKMKRDKADICFRSAGSHSPIDCVAIFKKGRKILLIQSKPRHYSEKAKARLEKEYKWLNGNFKCEFMVK